MTVNLCTVIFLIYSIAFSKLNSQIHLQIPNWITEWNGFWALIYPVLPYTLVVWSNSLYIIDNKHTLRFLVGRKRLWRHSESHVSENLVIPNPKHILETHVRIEMMVLWVWLNKMVNCRSNVYENWIMNNRHKVAVFHRLFKIFLPNIGFRCARIRQFNTRSRSKLNETNNVWSAQLFRVSIVFFSM